MMLFLQNIYPWVQETELPAMLDTNQLDQIHYQLVEQYQIQNEALSQK